MTLAMLRDQYLAAVHDSIEPGTRLMLATHFRHLTKALGESFPIAELRLPDLQGFIERRANVDGKNGRKLTTSTIKKEIGSLRAAWNWGVRMEMVAGQFPFAGLRFPKTREMPPFQTRTEIERRIKAGGLSLAEIADLWDSLYLELVDLNKLLEQILKLSTFLFLYPMAVFAAHTGARRSEMRRVLVADVDFTAKSVLFREC
jgi:integrase